MSNEANGKNMTNQDLPDAKILGSINSLLIGRSKNTNCAKLDLSIDDKNYKMDHKRRGFCLIFNHKRFNRAHLNERNGTDVDCNKLQKCFKEYGFDVKSYNDATCGEIKAILRAMAKEDHSDADCFACCILTHGELNALWAKDESYLIESIFEPFKGDQCLTLAGKPKLFFLQACRGDKLDPGVKVKFGKDVTDGTGHSSIPTWADFLIFYSTVPGYYSWRNTLNGSWFIQSLVEVLSEEDCPISFLDLLTRVIYKVSYNYESCIPENQEFHRQKQVPSLNSMLTRKLVLVKNSIPTK